MPSYIVFRTINYYSVSILCIQNEDIQNILGAPEVGGVPTVAIHVRLVPSVRTVPTSATATTRPAATRSTAVASASQASREQGEFHT